MRASSAVIKSFQTFILLHSFLRQMCIGKVSWEFGRRVKSSVKVFLKETNTRNSKETDQLKTEGGSRSTTALRRVRLAGTDSSTAALDQTKSAREKIPLFFATDLEDGSRKLGPLLSYTYSPPKELMAAGREPQTENASSMQEEIKHPDELTEPSVTNGVRPPTSIPGQNITDSLLKGDIPYMKVTCPLTEMKTPASSMQKVTIRFTYEVDTKNTSFVVSDIESMMFQSVVATLLDCGKTRQLLRNMRGRRKVKEDGVEKTLQFLAIDSIPGDTLRANGECRLIVLIAFFCKMFIYPLITWNCPTLSLSISRNMYSTDRWIYLPHCRWFPDSRDKSSWRRGCTQCRVQGSSTIKWINKVRHV